MNPPQFIPRLKTAFSLLLALFSIAAIAEAEEPPHSVHRDIVYAEVDGHKLALDLYLPGKQTGPLIVWVHGGAWRGGSKSDMPLGNLMVQGYPVASVDYRLSKEAPFPALIHDIKSAIRFLRSKGSELGVNADRIVVSGSSAGAHLAQLAGVSNGNAELEGSVGVTGVSSDVQAIVSFFGMSDFMTILGQSTDQGRSMRAPALQLLLGGQPEERPDLAKLASPVFHVNAKSPPLLLIHGDEDQQAPYEQSKEMDAAYKKAKAHVEFETIQGAGHGGEKFFDDKRIALVKRFIDETVPDVRRDIVYAEVGDHKLALDLYIPGQQTGPLVVWVHGGGWGSGSKSDMPLGRLLAEGFPIASVEYRLSHEALFPAQAHDIKAAIRFLRSKGAKLGVNADRIVISGGSAGGHLAQIVGVTNGNTELEGTLGVTGVSSDVQAIVSYFGMSDFMTILQQSTPHGRSVRAPALQFLLGGQPEEKPELAKLASPVFHVNAKSPPLLLVHGDEDPQAPYEQSKEMEATYQKAGARVELETVQGGKHGGGRFYDEQRTALVKQFINEVVPYGAPAK